MNRFKGRQLSLMQSGGLVHFGATVVFWLAAGVGMGRSEANHREHLV